jgi:tetratricopeptide (TPR) repeat protein
MKETPAMIPLPMPLFSHASEPAAMMQVGPNPMERAASPLPIPRRRTVIEPAPGASGEPQMRKVDRFALCMAKASKDPSLALAEAHGWLAELKTPEEKVRPNQCLGMLHAQLGQFDDAEGAFAAAIAGIPAAQAVSAVPMMAMAGNAALAGGHPDRALGWFDKALAVLGYSDNAALGGVQADRSRALVALGRNADAVTALQEAHRLAPEDAEGWLLSATLARRDKDLPRAQRDIEVAARLAPLDPAIGIEAGVIAVLDGRDEAARRSWESVVKAAPDSDEAKVAEGYLEQLGPAAAPVPPEKKPS